MSKRSNDERTREEHAKKIKLSTVTTNETTTASQTNNLLMNLPKDEFSHMISFLNIGEVIMLSLSCKFIHNFLNEHLQMIYPYVVNSYSEGKYPEWSIGRALKTHRRLVINSKSIDELNDVFNSMIKKNEPFSKLTKSVEIISIDPGLEMKKLLNLLSKSTGQPKQNVKFVRLSYSKDEKSDEEDEDEDEEKDPNVQKYREESPTLTRNLKSMPIGFSVKELIIDDIEISLSNIYQILSHCSSLEKLKLSISSDDADLKDFSIEVPLLENLKYLQLETVHGYDDNELKIAYDLVKLAPNLEYLEITYANEPAGNDFLLFLTQKCPNLKGISIDVDGDVPDLQISDEGILTFLKGEPKLEYLSFAYYCCNVSGEIFSKIGQFKNLRCIEISRDVFMDEAVDQCTDLKFGGGILNKLESISFGSNFSLNHCTQSEKEKFITSLIEMAPNIRDIGTLNDIEGIEILDYLDQLSPLLTVFPHLSYHCSIDQCKKIELWLKKSKQLEEIEWNFNVDLSNIEPIPSVKKLSVYEDLNLNSSKELSRVFPSLTELAYYPKENQENEVVELLKNGIWPDLKCFKGPNSVLKARPNLYGNRKDEGLVDFIELCKLEDETLQFEKEWLILDHVEEEINTSKMMKFLKK